MKKITLVISLIVALASLSSCREGNQEQSISESENETKVEVTTSVSESYECVDVLSEVELIPYGFYPYTKIRTDSSGYAEDLGHPFITCSAEYTAEGISVSVNLNDDDIVRNWAENNKISIKEYTRKVEYKIVDLDSLLYSEEQYTEDIDQQVTQYIIDYAAKEGYNMEVVKKYLCVYNGDGDIGELEVPLVDILYESNLKINTNYDADRYGVRAICRDENNNYRNVHVALHLNNGELKDAYVKFYDDWRMGYYEATLEECEEEIKSIDLQQNEKLVEYTK